MDSAGVFKEICRSVISPHLVMGADFLPIGKDVIQIFYLHFHRGYTMPRVVAFFIWTSRTVIDITMKFINLSKIENLPKTNNIARKLVDFIIN